jgi:hypothetical protein
MILLKQTIETKLKLFLVSTSMNNLEILYQYINEFAIEHNQSQYVDDITIINNIIIILNEHNNNQFETENNPYIVDEIVSNFNIQHIQNMIIITNFYT